MFEKPIDSFRQIKSEIFFGYAADGSTGILSAMAGIDHDDAERLRLRGGRRRTIKPRVPLLNRKTQGHQGQTQPRQNRVRWVTTTDAAGRHIR